MKWRTTALLIVTAALWAPGCKEAPPPGPPPSPGEALFHAVAQNKLAEVKSLLAAGANPNQRQKIGLTPGWQKIVNAVRWFFRSKPHYRGATWAPLHLAASRGFAEMVAVLVKAGADPNAVEDSGNTPLHLAVEGKHLAAVQSLLVAKPRLDGQRRDGRTALMLAAHREDVGFVRVLLRAGADPRVRTQHGWTALHGSANAEVAQALISARADVNAYAKGSGTPLSYATFHRRLDVVRALLRAKADVNKDEPLRHAVGLKDLTIARLLLAAGASVDVKNRPLLIEAVFQRNPGALKLLLKHGAKANQMGGVGMAALHHAASRGYAGIAKILLDAGADVNVHHSFFRRTPLDEATSAEMKRLLRSRGGKPGASLSKTK